MNISSVFAKGRDFATSIARKASNVVHKTTIENPIDNPRIARSMTDSAVDSFELTKKLSTSKTSSELFQEFNLLEEQSDEMRRLGKFEESLELSKMANAKFKEYSEVFDKENQLGQYRYSQETKTLEEAQRSLDSVLTSIHESQVESALKTKLEYEKILEAERKYPCRS